MTAVYLFARWRYRSAWQSRGMNSNSDQHATLLIPCDDTHQTRLTHDSCPGRWYQGLFRMCCWLTGSNTKLQTVS
jgi:hypothetical protein